MRISLPRHDLLGEETLTSLSEEKGLKPLSQWAFTEFSLHRDAYQRKEVWFTDNISGIMGVLLSQGLVDKVMSVGCKQTYFVLGPLTFKLRTFLAKHA